MPFSLPHLSSWSSEQELTLELIEKLPMGVVVWALQEADQSFRLLGCNAAAVAITGLDVQPNFGLPMRTVFAHVTADREAEYLRLALSGDSRDFGEVVVRGRSGGGPRTVGLRAFMLRPLVLVVVFDDRTELRLETQERTRIALELRRKEALFRSLVEGGRDALVVLDADARHLYATPSIEPILGYSAQELLGQSALDWVSGAERATLDGSLKSLFRTPSAELEVTVHALHKHGSLRRIELRFVNRLDEADVAGVVCVLRDVTEQERSREALRRTEEQLRQAQRVESIGLLAGGVAHDFNNLLSVVTGYVSISLEALDPEGQLAQDLWQVMHASERAAELTAQLLAFSRQQVLAPDIVDLNSIVERMDKMLRRVIGEHIELSARVQPGLGKVLVDPGQVEQVIMNLAVNARDAMVGGGSLRIETANVHLEPSEAEELGCSAGPFVMLAVSDTGLGMDEATQQRMYEPFFTTKERSRGTGLGLSTVIGIVQQSGGCITCRSAPGKGSRFEIYFPETQRVARRSLFEATSRPDLRGTETILVVEDEAQLRSLTRLILERSGYRVLDAQDGKTALELSERFAGPIELLLTDVVLPGMNGVVMAEQIIQQRPEIRVLYVSGYADTALAEREGVLFLQKPIAPEALRRKIREVLAGPSSPQS